ncbi:hypothetical protein ACHAP7_010876 [Fusarium lateritium]
MDNDGQLEVSGLGDAPEWSPVPSDANRRACDACRARKIDLIDSRLERAIGLLEKLRASDQFNNSSRSFKSSQASNQAHSSISTPASDSTQPKRAHRQVVEGDSSLTAHSTFANEFLQKVAATGSLQGSSPELYDTIDELSSILINEAVVSDELAYPHARPIKGASPPDYEMPPFKKAISLIRLAKDICLDVYFNDNHSEANFITINAGLYSLFLDYSFHVVGQDRDTYVAHAHLCRDNLETVLSSLSLHLPATPDTILALLFGSIYFIEKSLSLRLGRPSTIPDWDITVPHPSANDSISEAVVAYFVISVETARCQGNIYEMLYTPKSMEQPDEVKQSRVEALVSDLQNLDAKIWETNVGQP